MKFYIRISVLLFIMCFLSFFLSGCDNDDSKQLGCGVVKYDGQTAEQWANYYDNLASCVRDHSDSSDYDTLKSTADDCL